jgi:hypothetical protein
MHARLKRIKNKRLSTGELISQMSPQRDFW